MRLIPSRAGVRRTRPTLRELQRVRKRVVLAQRKLQVLEALDWMIEGEHVFSFEMLGARCGLSTTMTRALVVEDEELHRLVAAYRRFKTTKRRWLSRDMSADRNVS